MSVASRGADSFAAGYGVTRQAIAPVTDRRPAVVAALVVLAAAVWTIAISGVVHRDVGGLGLVSVLPVWSYVAFLPLAAAMAVLVHRPAVPLPEAIALTLVLIAILYGTSPLLSGEPRIAAAWRHLGVIDYVVRTGSVDPRVDVYHNWPGFFVLSAALSQAAGIGDLRPAVLWAPVWQSVLYLPALYLLLTSLTRDTRAVWLGIWIYYAANWIGQDYFAPQALGFFVYLVIVALLVRWISHRDAWMTPGPTEGPATPSWPSAPPAALARFDPVTRLVRRATPTVVRRGATALVDRLYTTAAPRAAALGGPARTALAGTIALVFGFVVTAHQLTPFFLLGAVVALALLLRLRWFVLVPLMVVAIGAWALFAAVPYLSGHIDHIVATSGTLTEGVAANLGERLGGSTEHRQVVLARLLFTMAIWLLAAFGVVRRLRTGHWDVTLVALAVAPFPIFALQSYGGEMLLRVALFALPAVALLGAMALVAGESGVSRIRTGGVFALMLVLMGTFMLTRYGNERLETFTPDEVTAMEVLYAEAPPGSMLIGLSGNVPWKFTRYEEYRYRPAGDDTYLGQRDKLLLTAAEYDGPVYLVITRAQRAAAEELLGAAPGEFDAFTEQLLGGGEFDVVYRNKDAVLARYTGRQGTAP